VAKCNGKQRQRQCKGAHRSGMSNPELQHWTHIVGIPCGPGCKADRLPSDEQGERRCKETAANELRVLGGRVQGLREEAEQLERGLVALQEYVTKLLRLLA